MFVKSSEHSGWPLWANSHWALSLTCLATAYSFLSFHRHCIFPSNLGQVVGNLNEHLESVVAQLYHRAIVSNFLLLTSGWLLHFISGCSCGILGKFLSAFPCKYEVGSGFAMQLKLTHLLPRLRDPTRGHPVCHLHKLVRLFILFMGKQCHNISWKRWF